MKFKKILTNISESSLDKNYWEQLSNLAGTRVLITDEAEINNHKNAEALLVKLGSKVPKDTIDKLPNLKYIGMLGTGYGGIDVSYAASRNITVTNIADYATEGVAEFTFGILLDNMRDISLAKRQAKTGDYSDDFSGTEIKGKKFGVIGLGHIGRRTAELAHTFGADVVYWSKQRKEDAETKGIIYREVNELLAQSDLITISLTLNSETDGFLNAERIKKINKGAIVINLSPMELLDFSALIERLKQQDITFMFDHSDEVTQEQLSILQTFNNCIIYPPIAYLTKEARAAKQQIFVDNLKAALKGKPQNTVRA